MHNGDFIPIITLIILIVAALAMSATFSLVETSMLTSRQHSLRSMANQGKRGAKTALRLIEDMDSLLGTVLLWNNFANVLVASLATVLAVRLLDDTNVVLSITSIITTITILILAEITPKAIGVRFAEKIACFAAPSLYLLVRITPVGKVVRGILNKVSSSLGKKNEDDKNDSRSMVAVKELLALIHDKHTLAEVEQDQKSMIYKLVSLHELSMRDIMRGRSDIKYVDLEDGLETISNELRACEHRMVPLCNDGLENVIGFLNVRVALIKDLNGKLDRESLERSAIKPVFVPETINPIKALQELASRKTEMSLVVDEYGGLVGLVTIYDYYQHIFSQSVNDATNGDAPDIVSGDTPVQEVNLRFGINLDEEEANTVGGFMVAKLGEYQEKPGATVETKNAVLKVFATNNANQITKIKISKVS